MKCTESEEEEPIKGKESQLQLSCFINQEVKYLATGLRLVRIRKKAAACVSNTDACRDLPAGLWTEVKPLVIAVMGFCSQVWNAGMDLSESGTLIGSDKNCV